MVDENILSDNKLLFLFLKLSGFVSFKIKDNERCNQKLEIGKCGYFLAACYQVVIQTIGFLTYVKFLEVAPDQAPNSLLLVLGLISYSAYHLCCFAVCICSFINAQKNKNFWQGLYNTEMALRKIRVVLNHKSLRTTVDICTLAMMTFLVPSLIVFFLGYDNYSRLTVTMYTMIIIIYHYGSISVIMLNFQHIMSFNVVKEMFGKLEDAAKENYLRSKSYTCTNHRYLLQIAKCYQMICKNAEDGHSAMSMPLVFNFVYIFNFLVTVSFTSAFMLINNVYISWMVSDLIWLIIIIITSVASVAISHICMRKVSFVIFSYLFC